MDPKTPGQTGRHRHRCHDRLRQRAPAGGAAAPGAGGGVPAAKSAVGRPAEGGTRRVRRSGLRPHRRAGVQRLCPAADVLEAGLPRHLSSPQRGAETDGGAGILSGKGLSGAVLWPLYAPARLCEHGQRGAVRLAQPTTVPGAVDAEQRAVLQTVQSDVPPPAGDGGRVRRRMDGGQQWDHRSETRPAQQRRQRRRGSPAQQPRTTGHRADRTGAVPAGGGRGTTKAVPRHGRPLGDRRADPHHPGSAPALPGKPPPGGPCGGGSPTQRRGISQRRQRQLVQGRQRVPVGGAL